MTGIIHGFIDRIGDFCRISAFSEERKVWRDTAHINLTRAVYNENKADFNFRNAVIYVDFGRFGRSNEIYKMRNQNDEFFLNDKNDSKDQVILEKQKNIRQIAENMRQKARDLKLIAGVILLSISVFLPFSAHAESAYDRVMRTGVLRCGYFEEVPFTIVDPNTQKHTGIAVELAETVASQLGLKLEWTEAVNFATLVTDLQSGRYDAICASVFNIPRGGKIDYTTPYIYVPSYAYVRPDEKRFDNNLKAINDAKVTLSILDGEGSSTIAQRLYPNAKHYSLPQTSEIAQMLLAVADKKADIGFVLPSVYEQFNKNNPGKLKKVENKEPFYVFSVSFGIRPNEPQLKDMFDIVIRQLVVSGEMDQIIDKYESKPGTFLRAAKPYRE